jgi:UDP-N-acetylmuramate dehydrogenase
MIQAPEIKERVEIGPHTTMKVGGPAEYFTVVRAQAEVKQACDFAMSKRLPVFVLGEGSNVIVSDKPLHALVMKMEIPGFEKVRETADSVTLKIGGGERWDSVVERAVGLGLSGIEALSKIPGTAGATPVQNVGAYGQEISTTLVELEAYDMQQREFVVMKADECDFSYRSSIFRGAAAGRYIITSITLKLSKRPPAAPTYESLKRYMAQHGIEHPTLEQIRAGVTAVRARILPDPSVVPSAGSFFKNPIVSKEVLERLEKKFEKVPSYKYGDKYKLAAGWIVEQCGFKGQEHFGLKLWKEHALVITNPNGATYGDLLKIVDMIVSSVQEKFGLTLEPEPLFIH